MTTWFQNEDVALYPLTRRIQLHCDLTPIEFHRACKHLLMQPDALAMVDEITIRHNDDAIAWAGRPFELVGPGRLLGHLHRFVNGRLVDA